MRRSECSVFFPHRFQLRIIRFRAFLAIRPFIMEGKQVLFNSLRQSMHLLSSIAYRQQGLARFIWSLDRKSLSIDGIPVHIPSFINNILRTLTDVTGNIDRLFRGCEYLDILQHIDQGMIPDESGKWFRDRIGREAERYSFLEEEENGFGQFHHRLLNHLAENSRLFGWVDGKLIPKRGESCYLIFSVLPLISYQLVSMNGSKNSMRSSKASST